MELIRGPKLPRKLKVGFSNSPKNMTHATFRDLGFAAKEDGTFDVYSAGGLGNQPKLGVKVAEAADPLDILFYIRAMYETFLAYGNYENRGKARTRYMQESLGGPEQYKKAYLEKLDAVYRSGKNLRLHPDELLEQKAAVLEKGRLEEGTSLPDDLESMDSKRMIRQKQEHLYAVYYHPLGGDIAPDESMYVINCTAEEARKVLELTSDSAKTDFECSVACIGASICQIGVRDSLALLKKLVKMEQEEGFGDGVLPVIHISGCPSSCGTHQIGMIGFHGGVKMTDKVPHPAFTLHYNGREQEGAEQFGETLGVIVRRRYPRLSETGWPQSTTVRRKV